MRNTKIGIDTVAYNVTKAKKGDEMLARCACQRRMTGEERTCFTLPVRTTRPARSRLPTYTYSPSRLQTHRGLASESRGATNARCRLAINLPTANARTFPRSNAR